MFSVKIHAPQSGFIRKGRHSAVLSPVKLSGDVLLHDERGVFAVAHITACKRHDDGEECRTAAGVTAVEKASMYAGRPWLADVRLIQQTAQDGKDAPDVAFMARKGKGWHDITPIMASLRSLCQEQGAGADADLAAVAKSIHAALDGIEASSHGDAPPLDLITDALAEMTADEPLQPALEGMAYHTARVQIARGAYQLVKHCDPKGLLAIKGACGYLAHVPYASRMGRDQLLVNTLSGEGYNDHRVYGRVRQGKTVFLDGEIPDDIAGKIAPAQAAMFADAKARYFIPLEVVKQFASPVRLPRMTIHKLRAGQVEVGEVVKAEIAGIDPERLSTTESKELHALLKKIADATVIARGSAREQYLGTVLFLAAELRKRGEAVELPQELQEEVRLLTGLVKTKKNDAAKNGNEDPIPHASIITHAKPVVICPGYVRVMEADGGFFRSNVDFRIVPSTGGDDALVPMTHNVITRLLPPHIAKRTSFETKDEGTALYDLALVPHGDTDKRIADGVVIEPCYGGDTIIVTKRADTVTVMDAASKRDITADKAAICQDVRRIDADVSFIAKASGDEAVVVDLLYHDEPIAPLWYEDRRLQLEAMFEGRDFASLRLGKSIMMKSKDGFDDACRGLAIDAGCRSVVCKAMASSYEDDSSVEMKLSRELSALVTKRSASEIVCAVGPVDEPEKWRETITHGDKHYVTIGAIAGKHAVKKGDIVRVDVLDLCVHEYDDGTSALSWTAPVVMICKAEGEIMTLAELDALGPRRIFVGKTVKRWIVKSEEERYVLAVVLEPLEGDGEHDAQNDIYSAEEIRKAFFYWTEKGRKFGYMHKRILKSSDVVLCENYLAPADFKVGNEEIKKGTWLQGTKVYSDELWKQIKSGEITGVSIGGFASRVRAE